MTQLRGKVAVVTGAARGIGRAVAECLANRGCDLALVDLEDIPAPPGKLSRHRVDVADRSQMEALPEAVLADHGRVDLVVNCAGVGVIGRLIETPLDDFEWQMAVNFWGTVYACKFFLPHLLERPEAHVVNVLSDFALIGFPTKTAYCASKFAVRGFSESLQAELDGTAVRLSCVYLGAVATDIVRHGRFRDAAKAELEHEFLNRRGISPERAAEGIVRAVERDRSRALIGRDARGMDLVQRLSPTGIQRLIARMARRLPFI
jgi:NAD(P)-dependent dehydrogenase (short-subunit alcohol dehydrogenase family)